MFGSTLAVLPWFVPGVVASMLIAAFAAGPISKRLGVRRLLVWAILVSVGVIVSATLTPLGGTLDFDLVRFHRCDLSRIGPAPIADLLRLNDTSLNVAMFIPLGLTIGLVGASRPRVALIVFAVILPVGIETIQLLAPILDRGCQSADVVDNLTGLLIGLVIGTGLRVLGNAIGAARDSGD